MATGIFRICFAALLLTSPVYAQSPNLTKEDPLPERVRETAEQMAQERYPEGIQQAGFASAYMAGFKSGLVSSYGNAMMGSGKADDPVSEGFAAGRAMSVSNTAIGGVTLLDYGYIQTHVTGCVFLAFEQSEMRPAGSTQVWWIAFNPEVSRMYGQLTHEHHMIRTHRTVIAASFDGWLSPERSWGYGHFNGYPREFVVTGIVEMTASSDSGL